MNEGMRKIDKMKAVIAQINKYLYGIERKKKKGNTKENKE